VSDEFFHFEQRQRPNLYMGDRFSAFYLIRERYSIIHQRERLRYTGETKIASYFDCISVVQPPEE